MMFYVGQKVVCVDDDPINRPLDHGIKYPAKRQIYTVRAWRMTRQGRAILLREIVNEQCIEADMHYLFEPSFNPERFRPLIERSTETGMAILRKVADDASKRRVVNA